MKKNKFLLRMIPMRRQNGFFLYDIIAKNTFGSFIFTSVLVDLYSFIVPIVCADILPFE